jgi:pyruvate formate lyase activating enzyme
VQNTEYKKALIFEIKGNSLDDGEGIRTVIFFKGCPLSCVWCHNPEGKSPKQEISFDAQKCLSCDTCMELCKNKAISRQNHFFIDRKKCDLCFECLSNCPSEALSQLGRHMTIEEIYSIIIKDKPFFDISKGGVSLSGGEPTLYPEFISSLLKKLKSENINTLIETCGYFDFDMFKTLIYPYVDMIYFDIKLYDKDEHKKYCGVSNKRILENFVKLLSLNKDKILSRVPLIPGITDTKFNLEAIDEFLKTNTNNSNNLKINKAQKAKRLPYNPLWQEKLPKIGVKSSFDSC